MAEVFTDFSMDCPNCGPDTLQFTDGEMVPHGCDYVPPAITIDCGEDDAPEAPGA